MRKHRQKSRRLSLPGELFIQSSLQILREIDQTLRDLFPRQFAHQQIELVPDDAASPVAPA